MATARNSIRAQSSLSDLARSRDQSLQNDTRQYFGRPVHSLVLCFVVLTLIFWGLLYWTRPVLVQNTGLNGRPDGTPSLGKSLLGGFLIALLITLVIWLFKSYGGAYSEGPSHLLIWFIVLALIFWALLYWLNPAAVQRVGLDGNPTGTVDVTKALLGAVIIALIIVLVMWLFKACQ
jgi:hypothetical protein